MRLLECSPAHADQILAILNDAIVTSTALWDYQPRPRESMTPWFAAKQAGGYPVIGAVDDTGKLLGFATYGPFRAWPAYKYSVEHSVYVDRASRGRGIGRMLLGAVIDHARAGQYRTLIAGIESGNGVSKALHRAFGFEPCGTIRHAGYKFGRWLDLEFHQLVFDGPRTPTEV